jgi:colicin import membrane protein
MPEPTDVQNVTKPTETPEVKPTSTETEKTGGKTFTEAEVEQLIKERLTREKSAEQKRLEAEKAKAEADALAKNAEWEKLAKQREEELAKVKADLSAKELADKKRAIAEKIGLPAAFAGRIQGTTDEELEADAKVIFDALPKPDDKKPSPGPTNPGEGGQPKETDAQRIARLTGQNTGFDWMNGGGVR